MYLYLLYYHVLLTSLILLSPQISRRRVDYFYLENLNKEVWIAFSEDRDIEGVILLDNYYSYIRLKVYSINDSVLLKADLINKFLEEKQWVLSDSMWRRLIINGLCDKFEIESYD